MVAIGCMITIAAMSDIWFKGLKGPLYSALLHTGFAIASGGFLIGAIKGYTGFLGKLLSFAPLCYLGTVSYGCYLYHLAVQSWIEGFLAASDAQLGPVLLLLIFALKILLTLMVASVSWYCFEKPINGFKDWFPMDYSKKRESRQKTQTDLKMTYRALCRIFKLKKRSDNTQPLT